MRLEYTLTVKDYKAALRLHSRQNLGRRNASLFFGKVLPGLGLFFLALEAFLSLTETDYLSHNPPGLLVVPLVFLLSPALQANQVRMQFNQLFPPSARSLSIAIDDERIVCVDSKSSESRFLWNAIAEYAQDEQITMLYLAKQKFLFFPTAAMSPDQRTELNDLVARHLPRGTS